MSGYRVSTEPFRERLDELVERGELQGIADLARRIGWDKDGRRLRTVLKQSYLESKTAETLAEGLNADPVDLGF